MDLSEIKDSIYCKKNLSFVIGYQLLEDEQKKDHLTKTSSETQSFFGYLKRVIDQNIKEIGHFYMELLENKSKRRIDKWDSSDAPWVYGLRYNVMEPG